jgi:hypothetical protein
MNAEDGIQAATDRVLKFANDWTAWERKMARTKDSLRDPAMAVAHAAIIAEHCTVKKRVYVDGMLSYGEPPTYRDVVAKNLLAAELVNAKRAHIDFKGSWVSHRFVVLFKNGEWRIDSVKWRVSPSDSWTNGLIGS